MSKDLELFYNIPEFTSQELIVRSYHFLTELVLGTSCMRLRPVNIRSRQNVKFQKLKGKSYEIYDHTVVKISVSRLLGCNALQR